MAVGVRVPFWVLFNNIIMEEQSVDSGVLSAITANTMAQLVKKANSQGIRRQDIVTINKEGGQFIMVYERKCY